MIQSMIGRRHDWHKRSPHNRGASQMRYSSLLRIAGLAVIALGAFIVLPSHANFDPGIASAWAGGGDDGGGNDGRPCPGGR
jgi:hypothetical protein